MKKSNWEQSITKFDKLHMYDSLKKFAEQIIAARQLMKKFSLPNNYTNPQKVVVCGMGGSVLATDVIKAVFSTKCPIEIVRDYITPQYVDSNTLIIASSYSGNTEETLSVAREAARRGAKVVVLAAGGELAWWASENNIPSFIFDTKENPCNSPRMGLGYSLIGQIAILATARVIQISEKELDMAEKTVVKMIEDCTKDSQKNLARKFARDLSDREWWFIGAEHLSGSAHVAANQTNENAKRFGGYFVLPELNHHLLEGLFLPKSNRRNLAFIFLQSDNYSKKIQTRITLTEKILKKNGIKFTKINIFGANKLAEAVCAITWSGFLSFYSAIEARFDPTAIPYVDFLKKNLH